MQNKYLKTVVYKHIYLSKFSGGMVATTAEAVIPPSLRALMPILLPPLKVRAGSKYSALAYSLNASKDNVSGECHSFLEIQLLLVE